MTDIQASARSLRELLRQRYKLGAYQREYEWQSAHVQALLKDLFDAFRPRAGAVAQREYFVGPITVRRTDAQLIDGQQRLTTFALIFIALKRLLIQRHSELPQLERLLPPRLRGLDATQLFVEPSRTHALQALDADGRIADPENDLQRALQARFDEISTSLIERLDAGEELRFAVWALDKVSVAEISAGLAHDAFALFDAMNSRGMPLQAVSQFKSWLHRRFGDDQAARATAMEQFQQTLETIALQGAGADRDFINSWLIARCIDLSARTPSRGSEAKRLIARSLAPTIEQMGPFFAIEHAEVMPQLGLSNPSSFVSDHWAIYGEVFDSIRRARTENVAGLEGMRFLEMVKFDFELFDEVALLAAVDPGGQGGEQRVAIALRFLENIAARWAWTTGATGLSARNADRVRYLLAHAAHAIRGKSTSEMAQTLALIQRQAQFDFSDKRDASHPRTGTSPVVHALLARMASYLDELNGTPSTFADYAARGGKDAYEIEHLLPRVVSNPTAEAGHNFAPDAYHKNRQMFASIILLPEPFNKEIAGSLYPEKRQRIIGNGNLFAKTIGGNSALPGRVANALAADGIVFEDLTRFDRGSVQSRQRAILALADQVWSENRLLDMVRDNALTA